MVFSIVIVITVLAGLYLAAHYNFWRPRVSKAFPRVLMYHSINDHIDGNHPDLVVSPQNFEKQLRYLQKQQYRFLTMSELVAATKTPERSVVLTFDDGFADNYTQMFPLLQKFQAKATIFLCPEMPDIDKLSTSQIREMQDSGLVEFGAHTLSHINLAQAANDVAEYEINESKQQVENLTGAACLAFAYPYGRLDDRVADHVRQAGFTSAVVVKKGIEAVTDPYRIKRISVLGKTDIVQFHIAMTRGRYRV